MAALMAVVFVPALCAGAVTFLLARRWPSHGAPRLDRAVLTHELDAHRSLRHLARRRIDPASATGLALTAAATLAVVGVTVVGVLLAMVRARTGLVRIDTAATRFGAEYATAGSTRALRAVSWWGGTAAVLGAAVSCLLASRWRRAATAAFLTVLVGGQFALSNLIKLAVARARPELQPLTGFAGTSFPSGHATAATACYLGFALLLGRGRSVQVKAGLAAAAATVAIAVSVTRVLLGVHWLSDVLAGVALGVAWFAAVSIAFGGRLLRFGAPVAAAQELARPRRAQRPRAARPWATRPRR